MRTKQGGSARSMRFPGMDVGVHDVGAMQHLQCGTDVVFEPDYFCGPQSSSWNRPEPGHQGAAAAFSKDCGDDREGRHSPQPGKFPLPVNLVLLADGTCHEARVGLTGVHLGRVALADGLACYVA